MPSAIACGAKAIRNIEHGLDALRRNYYQRKKSDPEYAAKLREKTRRYRKRRSPQQRAFRGAPDNSAGDA